MSEEKKKKPDHLDSVLALISLHKHACEATENPRESDAEEVDVAQPTEHLGELRRLLERIPLGEIARIIEAIDPDDRLLVWREVREERGESLLEILSDLKEEDIDALAFGSVRGASLDLISDPTFEVCNCSRGLPGCRRRGDAFVAPVKRRGLVGAGHRG